MPPKIYPKLCNNCGICMDVCPMDVFAEGAKTPIVAYPDECWSCGACELDCPKNAVKVVLPVFLKWKTLKVK